MTLKNTDRNMFIKHPPGGLFQADVLCNDSVRPELPHLILHNTTAQLLFLLI